MWRRTYRSMAILARTRISSGSSGQSRRRPRSRVMGAKDLIGPLSNELRSGEHGLARIEPILLLHPQPPEVVESGLPTPTTVRGANGCLPELRFAVIETNCVAHPGTGSSGNAFFYRFAICVLDARTARPAQGREPTGRVPRAETGDSRAPRKPPGGLRLPCASRQASMPDI